VLEVGQGQEQAGLNSGLPVLFQLRREVDTINQLWEYSVEGFISLVYEPAFVLDIEGNTPKARVVIATKRDGDNSSQKWVLEGDFIINKANGCIIKGTSAEAGAEVLIGEKNGADTTSQFKFVDA
jgi:hypothetical protein